MKKLQVLGSGCVKCGRLAEYTKAAADGLGIEYNLEKVTDMKDIAAFGVMVTPALVVDGIVKVAGRVPTVEEIQQMIK